jgi:amino acid transporter
MGGHHVTELRESIDISQRDDVHKLKANAVGLGGVLFACLAGAAPITAMLGNVPFGAYLGNGQGMPAAFAFATVTLTVFSVGYVAMARKITAVGGFYAFISHGLGRVMGVASGLVGAIAYMSIESALLGGMAYFAQTTMKARFDVTVPWPVFAIIGVILIACLSYFDVDLSLKVLGVALAAEVVILLIMDFGILFQGSTKSFTAGDLKVTGNGLNGAALNPASAFKNAGTKGAAAALGVFMAFWSWVGFEAAPNYAEESRDPVRNVPKATYISVVGLGVFYTFTSWMVISAWGSPETVAAGGAKGTEFFYLPTTAYVGAFFSKLMGFLVVTGSLACGMAFHNAATRYWYAMGREGLLPRALGKTHPKHKSAYMASALQTVLATALIVIYMVAGRTTTDSNADGVAGDAFDWANNAAYLGAYSQMAVLATYLLLILQTLVSIGIIVYFRKHPEDAHPWKTMAAPAIAVVMQLYVIKLLFDNLDSIGGTKGFTPYIAYTGLGIIAVGIAVSLYLKSAKPDVYENVGRYINSGDSELSKGDVVAGELADEFS